MHPYLTTQSSRNHVPVVPLTRKDFAAWLKKQPAADRNWIKAQDFTAKAGSVCQIPDTKGGIKSVLLGIEKNHNLWHWAALPGKLPPQYTYTLDAKAPMDEVALGWLLATYRFAEYKKPEKKFPKLYVPKSFNAQSTVDLAESVALVRNLINRPTNDLGPEQLANACKDVARECGAKYSEIAGDTLLEKNYPAIHAVGRASAQAPRLVDLRWGDKNAPKVTLVGKGVCFDTGGINLKPANNMALMKKDMGGAACVLGLARLIMLQKLPVRLRVLIPAVENSIGGNAFRPQDVLRTRKGLTVEIGNTDAEGRLILADALAEADDEKPDLLIDLATLTGASRVALGPDIPSFFTEDDALANQLTAIARNIQDPLWRLPLWEDYFTYMKSHIADMDNSGTSMYAGAITAALFLKRFVTQTKHWLHVDMMAWNLSSRPGRPVGGEAQGLRTLFHYLEKRYR